MVEIKEVNTKKMQREFVNFPVKLYKGNPNFVPPFYGDEMKMFTNKFVYRDTCDTIYFNAYRDGKMVGRISGIIQKASNIKHNEKRVRFCRIDAIDDHEVFEKLFEAVEKWALNKGMDTICGPLNFSDLEREGLLIEGFDELSTFEEQYNAPYYQKHIEAMGYKKEVDWTESKIYLPEEKELNKIIEMGEYIKKRYNLHLGKAKNVKEFANKYIDKFFDLLDESYNDIYGTVPFTDNMKQYMYDNFKLIFDNRYVCVVLDENEKMLALGICFPSLSKALRNSGGHLYPQVLIKLLKSLKHPEIVDLGLIGVDPEYLNRGISVVVMAEFAKAFSKDNIVYAETNLNLEDNAAIQNQWKRFIEVKHKRRRSYVKELKK